MSVLRITCTRTGEHEHRVKLEGRIAEAWVSEVSRVAWKALETTPSLTLDMSDVTFVDRPGVAVLRQLRDRGVHLASCSPFIANLVDGGAE